MTDLRFPLSSTHHAQIFGWPLGMTKVLKEMWILDFGGKAAKIQYPLYQPTRGHSDRNVVERGISYRIF